MFGLNCHDFKFGQNFVDEVTDFRASTVAALVAVAKLHVAEEDVGQHRPQSLADILR